MLRKEMEMEALSSKESSSVAADCRWMKVSDCRRDWVRMRRKDAIPFLSRSEKKYE
jgi:hypothetical protein